MRLGEGVSVVSEYQLVVSAYSRPLMVGLKLNSQLAQPFNPASQQRGRLDRPTDWSREHFTAAGDKGLNAESCCPTAKIFVIEIRENTVPIFDREIRAAIATEKRWPVFAVGEVETALAGDEELATD